MQLIFSGGCFGSGCRKVPVKKFGGLVSNLLRKMSALVGASFFAGEGC